MIEHPDFLQNKYHNTYFRIIKKAQAMGRQKSDDTYYESHHIQPKSIFGEGEEVLLTTKEHYICHWLLTKFTINESRIKLLRALNAMTIHTLEGRNWSSLEYRISREAFITAMRSFKHSEETKRHLSEVQKGRPKREGHGARIAAAQRGIPKPPGVGKKIGAKLKGRPRSPESIAKQRATMEAKRQQKSK